MRSFPSLVVAASLFAAFAACAADAPGAPFDPDNPETPGTDTGNTAAYKLSGTYELSSTFDIATNMPGTVGDVLNEIIDATDEQSDPAKWIVDKIIAQISDTTIRDALRNSAPFVVGKLNEKLTELAPEFVTKIKSAGEMLGDATKNFGTVSELAVTGSGTQLAATHTVKGVQFKNDESQFQYMFADYGASNIVANNVSVTLDRSGKVTIKDHLIPISFGKVAKIALTEVVIPKIDENARDLNELLQNLVNCDRVGVRIAESVDFGDASLYTSACKGGLTLGAGFIMSKIEAIDAKALEFKLNGTARAADKNRDNVVDELQRGSWAGTLSYASTPAPLNNAVFTGSKM